MVGACFDSPSLFELKHNNLKLMGSAQKRSKDGFFQHGSIPYSYNHKLNCELLNAPETIHASSAPFLSDPNISKKFQDKIIELIIKKFSPKIVDIKNSISL